MSEQGGSESIKRRGILAAAGAMVAGIVAKQVSQPVAAALTPLNYPTAAGDGMPVNNAGNTTELNAIPNYTGNGILLNVNASYATTATSITAIFATGYGSSSGIRATGGSGGNGNGVLAFGGSGTSSINAGSGVSANGGSNSGTRSGGDGVDGFGGSSAGGQGGYGVRGVAGSGTATAGVLGTTFQSVSGSIGVQGQIPSFSSAVDSVAVQGLNQSTGTGGIGVQGTSDHGLGASFAGATAPVRLVPGTLASTALAATGHQAGELYVTSDHLLYFFDGTAWKQMFFGSPAPSIPPPSGSPPPVTGVPNPAPPRRP